MPATSEVTELDELYTFTKNRHYLITAVDRETRCFMGWMLVTERHSKAGWPSAKYVPVLLRRICCLSSGELSSQSSSRSAWQVADLLGRGKQCWATLFCIAAWREDLPRAL